MFVSGVIVNWKMFYTIGGVWHFRKLKSNWKYISLTVKYPTHTWKIFYTIILPSNHFHSFENSSPHSLSSLIPSPSQRAKKATAGEAQIQSSTHNLIVIPVSPFAGEGSLSTTPPLSSLFHSLDPSLFLPQFSFNSDLSSSTHSQSHTQVNNYEGEGEHDRTASTRPPPTPSPP